MMKKVLLLSYRAPLPVVSGDKIRIFQDLKILSDSFVIDLAYIDDMGKEFNELDKYCNKVVRFPISKAEHFINAIYSYLFLSMPFQSGYFYSKKMQKWIDKNIGNYDYIFCIHIRTASYVMKYNNLIRIIDGVDAVSLNYFNKLILSKGFKHILYNLEYRRLSKYEKQIYKSFTKAILISEYDKNYVKEMGVDNLIKVIPNYVRDIGYDPSVEIRGCSIVFMGLMRYEPNINAVLYFANEIFPAVRDKVSDIRFRIIGGEPTNEIKELNKVDGIEVLGFVENPAIILQEATLVVAPMISGSGLQNKIIESMYLGKAVITTRQGAYGLTHLSGDEIIIAEDTDDFIQKLECWISIEKREELLEIGVNARNYVCKYFGYDNIKSALTKYLIDEEKDK
ncbi:Glycosyltransferase involved in cell wall bisynthesis [Anaerocolumna jejuensis DSM 15929]|uniref:Glycosyltransferase involved in cell wall bisynthesis n=1 Tax=Anaerocolumna jejuensis DSM 15929 TaxID=1121322 RepID=A0A1M6UGG2_9FIRM|nr:glycosyltransferase family 4 protein [Anaerocolumna jejuensis]SHK68233.1 Glycosyltransferase involved in cell wall bisynthesis [Anaerocolumna jejuensis DSM 15929]